MILRPPRSTPLYSSAASDVYKRQALTWPARPGSFLAARTVTCSPSLGWALTAATSRPASSPRRKAPAKPSTRIAASRRPATTAGQPDVGRAARITRRSAVTRASRRAGGRVGGRGGQVGAQGGRGRRQRAQPAPVTPAGEPGPVAGVGGAGVGRPG